MQSTTLLNVHIKCTFSRQSMSLCLLVTSVWSFVLNKHSSRLAFFRGAQPFWAKGRSVLFLVHLRAEEKNYKLNVQESSVKNRICFILLAFLLLVV